MRLLVTCFPVACPVSVVEPAPLRLHHHDLQGPRLRRPNASQAAGIYHHRRAHHRARHRREHGDFQRRQRADPPAAAVRAAGSPRRDSRRFARQTRVQLPWPGGDIPDVKQQLTAFESIAGINSGRVAFMGEDGKPEQVVGAGVTPNFFSTLGTKIVYGRTSSKPTGRRRHGRPGLRRRTRSVRRSCPQ